MIKKAVALFIMIGFIQLAKALGKPIQIICEPVSVTRQKGQFTLDNSVEIDSRSNDKQLFSNSTNLLKEIKESTGLSIPIEKQTKARKKIEIELKSRLSAQLGDEGYELNVMPGVVKLSANTVPGIFYALATIFSMEVESNINPANFSWTIPCVEVKRFP